MGRDIHTLASAGFASLSPSIWIQEPQHDRYNPSTAPPCALMPSLSTANEEQNLEYPELVIIASWTGANKKHIIKYTAAYNELYPKSSIMVVTTHIDDLSFHSTDHKANVLGPAVAYIQGRARSWRNNNSGDREGQRILLHAFSEGGSNKAVCLATAYRQLSGGKDKLPVGAFIFDSTPGRARFGSNIAAFKRSLPLNPVVRAVGYIFGFVVVGVAWVLYSVIVGFDNNPIHKTRRALNDATLWNLVTPSNLGRQVIGGADMAGAVSHVPRTYIFSENDDLIWHGDVEAHADESAASLGVKSLVVRFSGTAHCNHARGNEAYYWSAVRKTWENRWSNDYEISSFVGETDAPKCGTSDLEKGS